MEKIKNKTMASLITIGLLLTIAISLTTVPTTSAHTPAWNVPTFAYVHAAPNPVGIGQQVTIVVWLDKVLPGADVGNDVRYHNFKLTITKPDGTTQSINWDTVTDTTSSAYTMYTPDQLGNYKLYFEYPGQTYTWTYPTSNYGVTTPNAYTGDVYLPSNATTTFTVQAEPIETIPAASLPAEYWTRPIEGQNSNWYSISSNWLGSPQITNDVQPDGSAPNTPHIMWTKPLQDGGVAGGNVGTSLGATYYTGMSYEGKFANPIILQGRLYYQVPLSHSPSGGAFKCIDLQTGAEIWTKTYTVSPTFAQSYDFESENQHGVVSYLFAASGSTWIAYEPETGNWCFNITNVPSGTAAYTSQGEIVRYVLNAQNRWLALWNDTAVGQLTGSSGTLGGHDQWRPVGVVADGSKAYSWNVTIPALPTGASIIGFIPDDVLIIGANWGSTMGTFTPSNPQAFAISLKASNRGTLLWSKTYNAPENNITRGPQLVDAKNRVFITYDKETSSWCGYSVDTGDFLWGPVGNKNPWDYYNAFGYFIKATVDGKLYTSGYGGALYCIDTKTGTLLWTYGNGQEGNSTNSGIETAWGNYPLHIAAIADGKVYLFTSEHSPNSPLYKGAKIRCVNATTGAEIWTLPGWGESGNFYSAIGALADGYLAFLNAYDQQIYSIGKGPSQTTVSAPNLAAASGQSVVISGTVTDISTGTKQEEQAARFPNGVPVASDASMSEWMSYVYQQKALPTNFTGVQVTISVIDSNNNYRVIGTATTDAAGTYALQWTPDISGTFKVMATFAGTQGYWPSSAVTYFGVDQAQATATPQATQAPSAADLYFIPAIIGVIVAVIVVGAVLALLVTKKP